MIFTKNTNGTYTVDLPAPTKAPYTTSTVVYLDGVSIGTSLPTVISSISGVHKIRIYMTGPSGNYDESRCVLVDDELECKIFTKIGGMGEKERLQSNLPYLWFLVKEGSTDQACACVCDSIKTIYTDLTYQVNDNYCC